MKKEFEIPTISLMVLRAEGVMSGALITSGGQQLDTTTFYKDTTTDVTSEFAVWKEK
ncbi:MAG: hypothetical protein ACI4SS_07190 [Clostridia bacterium]